MAEAIVTVQYRATILQAYTMATLPNAATEPPGQTYLVTDEATGPVEVYCDDNNWRRVTDNELARALPLVAIINGQSNAVAGPPAPIRGASAMTKHLGADILAFGHTAQAFVQAVDGGASAKTTVAVPSSTTGPGVGQVGALLFRKIASKTGQIIRTYALAYTGQGVDYFLPTSVTLAFFDDNTQHGSLNNYNLIKSYVTVSGFVPSLYVWIQGEADAGSTQANYYGKLKIIFDQTRIDYPGIRWAIVGTIGNKQDRLSSAGQPVTAVRAAQKQLADENPGVVFFVDIADFAETAFMNVDDTHYATYCGYEEVAERIFTAIAGEPLRPKVSAAMNMRDAFPWTEFFYANKTVAAGDVSQWQTDVPPNTTVMVPHNAKAPLNVTFDAAVGNRSALEFDKENFETLKVIGLTATNDWTAFIVFKGDVINLGQFLVQIEDAGASNRVGLVWAGQSNKIQYFYNSAQADFAGGQTFTSDAVAIHTACFVVNTTGLTVTLYIDGVLFGTAAISGTEINMTTVWLASVLGTSPFEGRVYAFGYGRGVLATAQQAADMHAGARSEFKLAT